MLFASSYHWWKKIAAHGITEDLVGSDLNGINTIAKSVEGGFVLSGQKTLITNAPVADIFLIIAKAMDDDSRTNYTTFILEKKH